MKIFRRKRMRLIKEGKFQEYLLYALGEVSLLVIGILIAMQVNNMNARSKIEDQIRGTLIALEKDLKQNIKNASDLLMWNDMRDSVITNVLEKKVAKEMYQNGEVGPLYASFNKAAIIDENLNKILQHEDHLGEEYASLLKELKSYKSSIIGEQEINKLFSDYSLEQGRHLTNNYHWFYDFMKGEAPEDGINYFMNDPFYFNRLALYRILMVNNQSLNVAKRRSDEILLMSMIEEILSSEEQKSLKEILDDNGFSNCSLVSCNDSIPEDTSYQSFTNTLIQNNLKDTLFLQFWNNKGEAKGRLSLAPGTHLNQQISNECIIEQLIDESCHQKYKSAANTYLIFE
ncbi:MAG: hypothetical protein JKY48_10785 [Flavobacteriales bacterium]|nr:hypothetical protein [Flavobacteriales bacterium]